MNVRRLSYPLYVHITLFSVLLVVLTGAAMQWLRGWMSTPWVFISLLLVVVPLALAVAYALTRPLSRLAHEAEAVRLFDFSDHPVIRSPIREIDRLAGAFDLMRDSVRRFLRLNLKLAGESDLEELLAWLLDRMATIAGAQAGIVFLTTATDQALRADVLYDEGSTRSNEDPVELALDVLPDLLGQAVASLKPVSGHLPARTMAMTGLDPSHAQLEATAFPLLDRKEQLLGVMLLFNETPMDKARTAFIAALSASAALSLETRKLVREQKELFRALIEMLAAAIDAQSPYTGGHCARVPELTLMLARAACDADHGPYAGFDLDSTEWEAVHIAAWLHDCGKVTTPEFVVDKATKLETIYDRIHEVRMRFEVLKRDADIACWQAIARGGDEPSLRAQCDALKRELDEEFTFVARCNVGGEFLSAGDQARLRTIGSRRWLRTLDDSLGLSRDELSRRSGPSVQLPAEEALLADRPEHRIERPPSEAASSSNPWGFRMEVPELLYNRGELHNLTVSRGTLSSEERYKINEHIVQTIVMLSQLPFPRHLRDVPDIAGGHHEKMDGTGYPRCLTRDQLSPVARMMAIADIFEALTAADRPYKPGKTLSQALSIMAKMRQEQHIDEELFELFLRSGVYRDYANRFMRAEQIDEVRIDDYLGA